MKPPLALAGASIFGTVVMIAVVVGAADVTVVAVVMAAFVVEEASVAVVATAASG